MSQYSITHLRSPSQADWRVRLFLVGIFLGWLLTGLPTMAQEAVQDDPAATTSAKAEPATNTNALAFLDDGSIPTSLEQMRLMEQHVGDLFERVKAATVNIAVGDSQGSGVVVTRDGYILTAAHVINRPGLNARITFPDGTVKFATTLGVHRGIDSGMLKLNQSGDFPYLDIGESETLKRGQWVAAIGHPGGLDKERGLVLRVGRIIFKSRSVLRTDCALVGGDSGGPLVDMDGYVIGIHSRIGSRLSENMHVPIDVFSEEWDLLSDDFGVVVGSDRPFLGLNLKGDKNVIERIEPNQPADRAGLKVGDQLIRFNGKEIKNRDDLSAAVRGLKPRDRVEVVVERWVKKKPPTESEADESKSEKQSDETDQDSPMENHEDSDDESTDESKADSETPDPSKSADDSAKEEAADEEAADDTEATEPQQDEPEGSATESEQKAQPEKEKVQLTFELVIGYR